MSDLYGVLGVAQTADGAQIKRAYRALALACHPDHHGGDERAEQRFKEVNRAYTTLGRPAARVAYDAACAAARTRARRQLRGTLATLSASFLFTVSSGFLVGLWLAQAHL